MTTLAKVSHTPGPWELKHFPIEYRPHRYLIYGNAKEKTRGKNPVIGTVDLNDHFGCDYQLDSEGLNGYNVAELDVGANAKLIASAPELLSALIDLVSEIEAMPGGEYFDLTKYYQAIKKAK